MALADYDYQCRLYNYNLTVRKRKIAAAILLLRELWKRRSQKRCYIRKKFLKRRELGIHNTLIQEMRLSDKEQFINFHRMSPDKFDELLSRVGSLLKKSTLLRRDVIRPSERLSITLRYLASGDSYESLSNAFRVSKSSLSNIISETCRALWTALQSKVFENFTEEFWLKTAEGFAANTQFPNCIGAIGVKRIVMHEPNSSESNNIIFMGVGDADYCLSLVDIGASGLMSAGSVLEYSTFGSAVKRNEMNIPAPKLIPGSNGRISPHVLAAEAAFPMSNTLIRKFPLRKASDEKRIFNHRLNRAGLIIENIFGIIATRWGILNKPMTGKLENNEAMILAIASIHNFLQKGERNQENRQYCPANFVDRYVDASFTPGEWRTHVTKNGAMQNLIDFGPCNNYPKSVGETRMKLADYFMNEGKIPWQRTHARLNEHGQCK